MKLSPKKADFFDMIERVTKAGGRIRGETLADIFYPGIARQKALAAVHSNILQINEILEETDLVLKGHRYDGYRLEKRKL